MTPISTEARNLNWLVASFAEHTAGVSEAAVVSSDGLLIARSAGLDRAAGDRLAAVAAGLASISRGAAAPLEAGAVTEIVVEMERALLMVMTISDGSALAVTTTRPCDVGMIAYEMAVLVERAGEALSPRLVAELKSSLPGT